MNSLAKYGLFLLIIISCKDDEIILPVIKTNEPTNVFYNSATVSTELIEPGSDLYYRIGFVWNTTSELNLELKTVTKDSGDIPAVYEKTLCNLNPGTKYYYAPFVRTGDQIVWAETKTFTTPLKDQTVISQNGLIINVWTLCGWTLFNDSLHITDTRTYYEYNYPFKNDCCNKDTLTKQSEWDELMDLLVLKDFQKVNIDDCAVCVDGCEMSIQIDSVNITHWIRFDYNRFLTDNGYQDNAELQKIKPFAQKMESIRVKLRNG